MAVSPDGTRAYVTDDSSPGSMSVINTATDQVTATIGGLRSPAGVAVSPDGTRAYVPHRLHAVSVIDTPLARSPPPSASVTSPDGIGGQP